MDPNIWNVNAIFFDDDYTLTPGEWDDDCEYTFSHGHCHTFALAVQALLGKGELVGAEWGEFGHDDEELSPNHIALKTEMVCGTTLDGEPYTGMCHIDSHGIHWGGRAEYKDWAAVSMEQLKGWLSKNWYRPLRVEDATPHAEAFLAEQAVAA